MLLPISTNNLYTKSWIVNLYNIIERLRPALRTWKYLTEEMPLKDVTDYDSYWDNRQGKEFDLKRMLPNHRKRILAEKIIPDNSSILDVGCGTATLYDAFCQAGKKVNYIGYDLFDGLESIGADKKIEVHNLDILKAEPAKVDYITILNVLEHVQNPEDFILKLKDTFNKKMYISVPNIGSFKNRVRLGIFGRFPTSGVYFHVREHIRFWTFTDFNWWAKRYGFKVTNCWGAGRVVPLVSAFPQYFSENILYELERA
jgi:SAM-dependent methyltransferase